ncbi:DUF5694 domain-containing protein [Flavihumibacter solisilvae]|uniref:DUF5694 domain-containing protein n=1 Tax=Flavihumibacter solisilvae TaxID=1349421 RepID=UPI0012698E26|nr:DUF5694 domain-containing protein [Flavihumibacter solisilvae]
MDVAKFKDADILSQKRQREVEEVTSLLKRFAPDKIFIEAVPARQSQIDSAFTLYKAGKKELRASEVEQLGFRLAKQLGHSTLYGVDYQETKFPFDSLMKSATEAGQTGITSHVQKTIEEVQTSFNEALQKLTIKEMLLRENSEDMIKLQHEFYFKLLPAGKPGNHVGSYLVSEWWRRNMVICENILKQLNGNEEKVLVIFGSGHTAILNEIMKFNPAIKLVPASEVLR